MNTEEKLDKTIDYISSRTQRLPQIAVILGSGLGDFADALSNRTVIPTTDIPYYPKSTVEGHQGKLVFGKSDNKAILAFQGRVHFYECNDLETVLYPIHVAHRLGVKTLIVTNAAGGINRTFRPGDLMAITDQINLTFARFTSPTHTSGNDQDLYSHRLTDILFRRAEEKQIRVCQGTYVGVKGPSYETASEVEMIRRIGGDAVGMSTVFEASLAASLGMEVLGISCITNFATGITSEKLSHAEVTEVGNRVKNTFRALVESVIEEIDIAS